MAINVQKGHCPLCCAPQPLHLSVSVSVGHGQWWSTARIDWNAGGREMKHLFRFFQQGGRQD